MSKKLPPALHGQIQTLCADGDRLPGQLQFEDVAADELARAYMGAGREIFAAQVPAYLDFLATRTGV